MAAATPSRSHRLSPMGVRKAVGEDDWSIKTLASLDNPVDPFSKF